MLLKHLILFLSITLCSAQFGLFGCMSTLNTQITCPVNRTLEIIIYTGMDNGANSDNLDITVNFYDTKQNLIAALPLKWPNCNPYEKGNIDTIKGCANWVELVKSVSFNVVKSDQMQVEALTVSLGQRTATFTKFWFDDAILGNYMGWPVFSKLDFSFKTQR